MPNTILRPFLHKLLFEITSSPSYMDIHSFFIKAFEKFIPFVVCIWNTYDDDCAVTCIRTIRTTLHGLCTVAFIVTIQSIKNAFLSRYLFKLCMKPSRSFQIGVHYKYTHTIRI